MDILHLVDKIEDLFNDSKPLPFTRNIVIDEDKLLDIIDQMRVTVPEEIKKAQQIVTQKDRIIAQAQEEANRIIELAKDKAEQIVERESIVKTAQNRSALIIRQAREDASQAKSESDAYILESLQGMESEVTRLLTQVRNGIRQLEEDRLRALAPKQAQMKFDEEVEEDLE
ncbi:MAG TPA: hypothetical protein VN226_01985 [Anaerolineales bacterium]|nr:hypothetical protein [Anaerolineales bacterium]